MESTHVNFCDPTRRKTVIGLIEVAMSNPCGDPDNGNHPRSIPNLNGPDRGYITPTCLKRWVRDNLNRVDGYKLYIARGADLEALSEAHGNDLDKAQGDYIDLRLFGGMIPSSKQRRPGPLVATNPTSIDPVEFMEITGTSVAGRPKKDAEEGDPLTGVMHGKHVVVYGVYRFAIHFDPAAGKATGVTEADLRAFFLALRDCTNTSRSGARPDVNMKRLWIYDQGPGRGCTTPDQIDRCVEINRIDGALLGVDAATAWSDYEITLSVPRSGVAVLDLMENPDALGVATNVA